MDNKEFHFGSIKDVIMGGIYYEKLNDEFYASKVIIQTEYDDKVNTFISYRTIKLLMVNPHTDVIIGFGRILLDSNSLDQFVIDSNYRNKGYGKKFIDFAMGKYHINNLKLSQSLNTVQISHFIPLSSH